MAVEHVLAIMAIFFPWSWSKAQMIVFLALIHPVAISDNLRSLSLWEITPFRQTCYQGTFPFSSSFPG